MKSLLNRFIRLYIDGFRNTIIGKKLLLIVFIKLFIMFAILKIFFFPNFLKSKFATDAERSNYVLEQLTKTNKK